MASLLWNKFHYIANINCLADMPIRAFDMRKANISVLREANQITEHEYRTLFEADKMTREVYIGKLLGSKPELSAILSDGIKMSKKLFFEANGIEDSDILEINNDAVYIIGYKPVTIQQITPYIYFKLDEEYTAFYRVKKISYYYGYNPVTRTEVLRAKGLGETATALHEPFMLDFLKELFKTAQLRGYEQAIKLLMTFYRNYVSRSLPIGYYRNLNSQAQFEIGGIHSPSNAKYYSDIANPWYIDIVDISYNEEILRDFNKLLSYLYLRKR